jgi:hypothetical protein
MRTHRKTKKVIRGGHSQEKKKDDTLSEIAKPATIYYIPAISSSEYLFNGENNGKFVSRFGCILNTTDACKNAAAKVEYCANKLFNQKYSTNKLDNYYKDNMEQILTDSGCYAFLDFIIRANRRMNNIEFNNYNTFLMILNEIFLEKFYSHEESKSLRENIYLTQVRRAGNESKYNINLASKEAKKYKVELDRFLSVWSTKTLNDRYERVMALKVEVDALDAASEKAT